MGLHQGNVYYSSKSFGISHNSKLRLHADRYIKSKEIKYQKADFLNAEDFNLR